MLRAVLFDVGGVLAYQDTTAADQLLAKIHPLLTSEAVAAALVRPTTYPLWEKYSCGQMRGDAYWRAVLRDMGHEGSAEEITGLRGALAATWWARLDPDALVVVERLRTNPRICLGVLSNSCLEHDPFITSIQPLFDVVRFSHRTGLRKPSPGAYEAAAADLGVSPQSVLFIDDKKRNLPPATEIGMKALLYTDVPELVRQLTDLRLLEEHSAYTQDGDNGRSRPVSSAGAQDLK